MKASNKDAWARFTRPTLFQGEVGIYDMQMAEVLDRYIRPMDIKEVVEYGCGDGCWLEYLGEKYPLKNFYGYEWNETLLGIASKRCSRLKNIKLFLADIRYKFHENCDLFFAIGLIEHFDNHLEVLRNIVSGLKINGVCIISVPNPLAIDNYSRKRKIIGYAGDNKERIITDAYGYEELWYPKYFIKVLESSGLRVLEYWNISRWRERNQVAVCLRIS